MPIVSLDETLIKTCNNNSLEKAGNRLSEMAKRDYIAFYKEYKKER